MQTDTGAAQPPARDDADESPALAIAHCVQRVFGAFLFSAICLGLLYADFWLVVGTLSAMGFSVGELEAPTSADLLTGAAFILTAAF